MSLIAGWIPPERFMTDTKQRPRIGGMICSGSAAASLTHTVISGAAGLNEGLTNAQIKKALKSGCLVLTLNKSSRYRLKRLSILW